MIDNPIPADEIKLVLADVDGTLVTRDKTLTARAIAAVRRLGEAGIAFTVTSSRPPRGLASLVAPLGLIQPLGGFNGGAVVRPDMTVISRLPLGRDPALRAIDIILRHDLDAWVYDDEDWLVRDAQAPHVAHEAYTLGFAPIVVADVTARLDQVGKIVAVGDDPTAVDRCNLALAAALGGSASATRSQSFFIDITHPDANKGKMVETIAELLRIAPSAVATIGDMPNDVLMFDKSGLSVAMGNATDDVKAKANRTTDSNEDEGFAKAMERLLQDRKEGAA